MQPRSSSAGLWAVVAATLSWFACGAEASSPIDVPSALPEGGGSERLPGSDALWLVSSRHAGCLDAASGTDAGLEFFRRDAAGCWASATAAEFDRAADAAGWTCFYVHGNRIEPGEAFGRGAAAYRAVFRGAGHESALCFVTWSWPSSQICGPCRDPRVKAARTHAESYRLASFLARHPQQRLSLVGYSFGGRIVCGALHLLGGGSLGDRQLAVAGPAALSGGARVVLLASASDSHWLLPGGYHDRCLEQVDYLLNVYNPHDPALRRYPRLERGSRDSALGYSGLPHGGCFKNAGQVEQLNAACAVGRSHDEDRYFGTGLAAEIRSGLMP